MLRRVGLLAALVALACSSKSDRKIGGGGTTATPRPSFSVFALAEVRGQIGPCGCTSDPLGDLSRTSRLIETARAAGPVLVVDAGSLLYSKSPVPEHLDAQEELKADLLVATYRAELGVAAVGLGPADLAKGPSKLRVPRQVVNVKDPAVETEPPKLITVGGVRVGVFGVIAPGVAPGLTIEDPVTSARAAVSNLRAQGAQVVVGLVQAPTKRDAVKLVRDIGGIDLAVAGLGAAAPEPERVEVEATRVGTGWLVVPANRGQVIPRIDVTWRDSGPLVDAVGPGAATAKIEVIDRQLARLDADLAGFTKDPDADQTFVAQKQAERARLAQDRARLATNPLSVPAAGSYFTLDQIRIHKRLACSTEVQTRVLGYNRAAGKANVAAATAKPPPPPPKGTAVFVGTETCADCHDDAVTFWKTTRHARAWQTLEKRGQQFDLDCFGCHVTGSDLPGGATLANNEPLRDVQCEVCHGPGSIHVDQGGEERPPAVRRNPPTDLCATQCHTKEHSDTFDLDPYLRDVVGPGHGQALRAQLGDGPTGHELRARALDKAGRDLGTGCVR